MSIKNSHPGYYSSQIDFDRLWNEGLFVFDTNILLRLYRTTLDSRREILSVIKQLERRWLPHQVSFEYSRNRVSLILEMKNMKQSISKQIKDAFEADKIIDKFRWNPYILFETLGELIESSKKKLIAEIDSKLSDFDVDISSDPILEELELLFIDRVGESYSIDDQRKIENEGKYRYDNQIPPGYLDKNKNNNEYGDYIIWRQIIDKAKQLNTSVVFITDDKKDDWWLNIHGQTISPRPELMQEFYEKTNKIIYFYKLDPFLTYSKSKLNKNISDTTIQEIRTEDKYEAQKFEKLYKQYLKSMITMPTPLLGDQINKAIISTDLLGNSNYSNQLSEIRKITKIFDDMESLNNKLKIAGLSGDIALLNSINNLKLASDRLQLRSRPSYLSDKGGINAEDATIPADESETIDEPPPGQPNEDADDNLSK